jgi:ubiquinone/menaquinone biosynthesis C-methylase UbiE
MSNDLAMARYYAERAKQYERIYAKPERQEDLARLRTFVEHTFTGLNVLEVACGTGYWTEVLARSAASVVATDINEEVLAIARAKSLDPQKVILRREDVYGLARPPRPFNGGLAAFWWSHVPKQRMRPFLRAFHRRFSPGAKVVFIDNAYVEGSSTPLSRRDESGDTYQLRKLDDGSEHEVLKNFPAAADLRAAVAGLATEVRVEFLKYYWTLSYQPNTDG